ncbi:glycosyltransferase family 2 protein [Microbacterium hominis]|uniref:glycosyltransferase family 2 protein n=1 Tax=Microbacterium hominis TaxID=162426 RepID=UPI0023DD3C38|nr:glycosyltransferase [Microbacterium hominis]
MSLIRLGTGPDQTDRSRSVPPSRTAVIVTCYNQERFIRQSLDSIAAQTREASEVVVIDGCSQDRSVRVIERWIAENDMPITFIAHDRNYGLCATLNQGMSEISSDFVLTLYGDDWLEPTRIERQVPVLESASEDVCMVVGNMREVDRRGIPIVDHDYSDRIAPLQTMSGAERLASLVSENVIPSPAVLLKADEVRRVGGYDESLTFDDYDMWLRLLKERTLLFEPDIVVNYRLLGSSLSRNPDRHGDFLLSEARMMFKHRGTPETDHAMVPRLRRSAQTLQAMGDIARLERVEWMIRAVEEGVA